MRRPQRGHAALALAAMVLWATVTAVPAADGEAPPLPKQGAARPVEEGEAKAKERPGAERKGGDAGDEGGEAEKSGAGTRDDDTPEPEETKPVQSVRLPGPGEYAALEIIPLAGALTGCHVRIVGRGVEETKVEISTELGGTEVDLEELTVLLAASRLFLFRISDPKEGEVLVVSTNPRWEAEPPRFTEVLSLGRGEFEAAARQLKDAAEKRNAKMPAGLEPVVVVPAPKAGKIFVSAPREEDLEAVMKVIESEEARAKDPDRPRLYAYLGRFRPVAVLEEKLLEKLEQGEKNRLRIVVTSKGNRLLFRCPQRVGDKVLRILQELDVPVRKRREPSPAPEAPPAPDPAPR